jgi:excisionase family DNA binding protein
MTALMDAGRAAELLSVPPSWLLAQARKGAIPHVRLGRYVRFRESDVEELIAAGATGSLDRSSHITYLQLSGTARAQPPVP